MLRMAPQLRSFQTSRKWSEQRALQEIIHVLDKSTAKLEKSITENNNEERNPILLLILLSIPWSPTNHLSHCIVELSRSLRLYPLLEYSDIADHYV